MIALLLLLAALICFALAAFSVPVPKVNMLGLGFAFVTLLWLIEKVGT